MKNRHLKSTKQSRSAEYQYLELGKEILANGIEQVDRGTKVKTYSVFGIRHVYDLSDGFPLLTTKRVYWNGVIQELYWFLSGQTNIKYLVDHSVHIWDDYPYKIYLEKIRNSKFEILNSEQRKKKLKQPLSKEEFIDKIKNDNNFARRWGELPHIYGEMWRKWPTKKKGKTVDQLQWVIDEVRADPSAHNLIVNSWNPEYLYTMADKSEAARFPICHNMYQISNRNGKLDLILYQRSCDYFLGVPFNIASYSLLCMVLAKILKLKPGRFIHVYGDIHIYENHLEQVKEQIKRKPNAFPKVKIDKSVVSLETFSPEKVTLLDYNPQPTLKADLVVAGGYYEPKK